MVRMLFLRDIDTDVQIRCRSCGHTGILPRGQMVRRFGPSYPVLSIAPHFRCSQCLSRDTESFPATAAAAMQAVDEHRDALLTPMPAPPAPEPEIADADDPLALLRAAFAPIAAAAEREEAPVPPASVEPEYGEPEPMESEPVPPAMADDDPKPPVAEEESGWSLARLFSRAADGNPVEELSVAEPESAVEEDVVVPDFAIRDREAPDEPEDGPSPHVRDAMAVLRSLVEDAAGDAVAPSAPPPRDDEPPLLLTPADEVVPEPRRPVREADSFENTLSKLRSLLDLDAPPEPPPPRGSRLFRRRK